MPPRRHTYTDAEIAQVIAQSVAQVLAAQQNPGGAPANAPTPKPCTYKDFLNCKPLYFKGSEGAIGLIRWIEKAESVFRICNCAEEDKVKFSVCTLSDGALTWWNSYAQTVGIETAYQLPWEDLKTMLTDEYCPREQLQQLEEEFWKHTCQGNDIIGYTTRFHQLAVLCPSMVDPEHKRIERYICGLPESIQGNVTSSKPGTIQSAVRMAHELMAQIVRRETLTVKTSGDNKRKWSGNDQNQQNAKRPESVKAYTSGSGNKKGYTGTKPFCSNCNRHHDGPCGTPCDKCKRYGHLTKDCRMKSCYECGNMGHFRSDCPKLKKNNNARGRAYVINAGDAHQDPNADMGTCIPEQHK